MKILFFLSALLITLNSSAQQSPVDPALASLKKEKDTVMLNHKLAELQQGSDKNLSLLLSYYNATKNTIMADQIITLAKKKFPKGEIAIAQARRTVYREPDAVQKEKLAEQFKRDFPAEKFHSIDNSVAYSFAEEKNTAKAKLYLSAVKDPVYRPDAVYKVVKEIMKYDISSADDLAFAELASAKSLIADQSLTKELIKNQRYDPMDGYQIILKLYTDVLIKKENYNDALNYYEEYRKNQKNKGTYLDKRYTLLLSKNKRYKEAFPDLEKLAATGKADEQMKGELRMAFAALNPGKNIEEYMLPFSSNLKEKYAEEAIKSVIREKSPNFTVTDVNGKNVSLQDYK
ncbi:MAG: hypothetical protein EOP48_22570, partial [Sphingobacteriales bacterium]